MKYIYFLTTIYLFCYYYWLIFFRSISVWIISFNFAPSEPKFWLRHWLVYHVRYKHLMRKLEKSCCFFKENRKLTKTINTILRRLLNSAFLYKCSALVYVFHNSRKENCFRKTKPPHMHVHMLLNLAVSRGEESKRGLLCRCDCCPIPQQA